MRKMGCSALAASVIGGAMLLFGPAPASATTLPGLAVVTPGATALVEEVYRHGRERTRRHDRSRRDERRARRYDRRHHGARFRDRRPGFHFYYDGYYYAQPWWLAPGIGIGVTVPPPVSSAHVQWCLNRYRSYDPPSDTFMGFDGIRRHCNSPYR